MSLVDVLKEAEQVKPIDTINGMKIVPFETVPALAQAALVNDEDLGGRTMNLNGTVARSRCLFAAVNVDNLYINRYKMSKGKLYVITDYRAIKDQSSGRIYAKQIPAYVFGRKEGELVLEKMDIVSDVEFVSDFTQKLSNEAMQKLMPLLVNSADIKTADDLPI